jgi:hypothetical protein
MNLFWLALAAREAALAHVDKHVVKMILETTQLLYTAQHANHADAAWREAAPIVASTQTRGYRLTHLNHPCSIWVRQSMFHYNRTVELGLALCEEYTHRYLKKHACEEHLVWLRANPPPFPNAKLDVAPPLAMPDEYKTVIPTQPFGEHTWTDVVNSYRAYYIGAKHAFAKWTKREQPEWWGVKRKRSAAAPPKKKRKKVT